MPKILVQDDKLQSWDIWRTTITGGVPNTELAFSKFEITICGYLRCEDDRYIACVDILIQDVHLARDIIHKIYYDKEKAIQTLRDIEQSFQTEHTRNKTMLG